MIATQTSPRAGRRRGPETPDTNSIPPRPPARKSPTEDYRWYGQGHPHYIKLVHDPNRFWRWCHNAPENRKRPARVTDVESASGQNLEAQIAALRADVEKLKQARAPQKSAVVKPNVIITRKARRRIIRRLQHA